MGIMNRVLPFFGDLFLESFTGRKRLETTHKEMRVPNPAGPALYAHIHRPADSAVNPGVVLVPGASNCGTDFDLGRRITASDVASLGFTVIHYDPSGRGKTGGIEDYWGPVHQRELAALVEFFSAQPEVESGNVAVFSFSIGICIAAGAIARYRLPSVRYLFDWEGPSNRFNITQNDTHKHLGKWPSSDVFFWEEREPVLSIGEISCGYFRYQAMRDHVQGSFKGHAIELVNLAERGAARWTRMNGNPPGTIFDEADIGRYDWVPAFRNHKGQVLKYFLEAQAQGG